ncbi:hypothetical protein Ciccas_000022 [Cichlidogyrus casuarinus]|uniref:Uncharacterized protein n=1 Tax=Cichlidogyrus casuarinus TaxID=1844966 RepID=A0ABD2QP58_9PLAT
MIEMDEITGDTLVTLNAVYGTDKKLVEKKPVKTRKIRELAYFFKLHWKVVKRDPITGEGAQSKERSDFGRDRELHTQKNPKKGTCQNNLLEDSPLFRIEQGTHFVATNSE